jgi:hypothetical protein
MKIFLFRFKAFLIKPIPTPHEVLSKKKHLNIKILEYKSFFYKVKAIFLLILFNKLLNIFASIALQSRSNLESLEVIFQTLLNIFTKTSYFI